MNNRASKGIKDYVKKPIKPLCRIGDTYFIVIPGSFVEKLNFDQGMWLEQELIEDEILIKKHYQKELKN
jgi:antitoxin component of MazEF toxin-antitoxin module